MPIRRAWLMPLAAIALLGAFLTLAEVAAADGAIKLRVRTASQDTLLDDGKLKVRVSASGDEKVTLGARQGNKRRLVRGKSVSFDGAGSRLVRLRLSERGLAQLSACGPQLITVEGRYTRGTASGAQARVVERDSRRLRAGSLKCILDLNVQNADRCDPIDTAHCLAPFPNDYFTVADPSSGSARRVNLNALSMPVNINGQRVGPAEYNRNDGFSPNSPIITRVLGIETQAAFDSNGIVPQTDIGEYARPDQPVVLINAATGQRHPVWAELDEIPSQDSQRTLIIRPAEALTYGQRYVVALRGLNTADGAPLEPTNQVFKAYRDKVRSDDPAVEARRDEMESIFTILGNAGIARDDLYLAWDFTVSSRDSLTGRLRAMRDDAFDQLGDANLADGDVVGVAPQVNNLAVTPYALCNAGGGPECDDDESDYALRKITGTVTVPCYMDAQSTLAPPAPERCGPGSRITYAPGTETPVQTGGATFEAPFTCLVPRAAAGSTSIGVDKPGLIFGHGLLGDDTAVEDLRLFPGSLGAVACGSAWIGMSSSDLPTILPQILIDLDKFPALVDRSQQGMLNFLYLARAMAHDDGLTDLTEFQDGPARALDANERVGYLGASQGGIFGGAATSVAPDWNRAVLGVPGMGFSTLLTRSTQFNQFLPLVYTFYNNPVERQIGFSLLQMLWDRGETGGYVHAMTDDELPNTPEHKVVLIEAFGDHQVTNVQTESEARTIDAVVRTPALPPGRSPDSEPFWGITPAPSSTFTVPGGYTGPASLFVMDTGATRVEDWDHDGDDELVGTNANPISNRAPVDGTGLLVEQWFDGLDPHEPVASSPAMQAIAAPFLSGTSGVTDPCLATGGIPVPCFAPPIHVLGEGL